MSAIDRLRRAQEVFSQRAEGNALELRMQFATAIRGQLTSLGWTQRHLAQRVGAQESRISKLIHGDENFTLGTLTKVLDALGLRARLQITRKPSFANTPRTTAHAPRISNLDVQDYTDVRIKWFTDPAHRTHPTGRRLSSPASTHSKSHTGAVSVYLG